MSTKPYTAQDVAECVELTKAEILEDMGTAVSSRGDVMPETITSFSELHDYVDANTYGTLCDEDSKWHYLWDVRGEDDMPASIDFAIEVQDAVDAWLKAGRP